MKKLNKIFAAALTAVLAVSCNDLDTEPLGGTVTSDQKDQLLEKDPSMAKAALNALPEGLKLAGSLYSSHHADYGVPSLFMITDSRGMDMPAPNVGFNWYAAASEMGDFAGNYYDNLLYWKTFYNEIYSTNLLIGTIDPKTENAQLQHYLANGYVFRAYCYFNLAQMYQFTYTSDPEAPTVPVVTAENADSIALAGGAKRATGEEIYGQILTDLNNSIDLLTKSELAGQLRESKRFVNAMVAYGLRARVNLVMGRWADAAADARQAITLAQKEGLYPYSIQEASVPAFYKMDDHNVMWGIQNLPSEGFTQGVRNFASMMGSWMNNGYCSTGTYRCINKKLYNSIPDTDVRKGWWLNGDAQPSATMPVAYANYIADQTGYDGEFLPYTQVKFGAADNAPGQPNGATDVPLMRVEEMYLILAEAEGMQTPATGLATLNEFVKTYRDPAFNGVAADTQTFSDLVWNQRRIELWGEGFSYFDMMRLRKPLDRRGGGFDPAWVFYVEPDKFVLIYKIVQDETQSNKNLGNWESIHDSEWVAPSPVPDED